MITTPHGYQKPQAGDRGSTVFDALEFNIDRVDDHKHNGVDSPKLGPESSAATEQALSPTWVTEDAGEGVYYQTVTLPSSLVAADLTVDTVQVTIRTSLGEFLYPRVVRQSPTTFRVYSNDPTLLCKAIYVT